MHELSQPEAVEHEWNQLEDEDTKRLDLRLKKKTPTPGDFIFFDGSGSFRLNIPNIVDIRLSVLVRPSARTVSAFLSTLSHPALLLADPAALPAGAGRRFLLVPPGCFWYSGRPEGLA